MYGLLLSSACTTPTTTSHVGTDCTANDIDDFAFTFTSGGALFHPNLKGQTFRIEFEHLAGADARPDNQQFTIRYGAGNRIDGHITLMTGGSTTGLKFDDMYAQGPSGGPSGALPIDETYSVTWVSCTYDAGTITVTDQALLTVTSEKRVPR